MGFTCAQHSSVLRWPPCCDPESSFLNHGIYSSAPKTYTVSWRLASKKGRKWLNGIYTYIYINGGVVEEVALVN